MLWLSLTFASPFTSSQRECQRGQGKENDARGLWRWINFQRKFCFCGEKNPPELFTVDLGKFERYSSKQTILKEEQRSSPYKSLLLHTAERVSQAIPSSRCLGRIHFLLLRSSGEWAKRLNLAYGYITMTSSYALTRSQSIINRTSSIALIVT